MIGDVTGSETLICCVMGAVTKSAAVETVLMQVEVFLLLFQVVQHWKAHVVKQLQDYIFG